jgi:hypothetical protein
MRRFYGNTLLGMALGCLMSLTLGAPAAAGEAINTTGDNIAIKGYDTVAYFVESRPVKGTPEFEHVWQGARWHFANAEHRDMFASDPVSYAPRFGGFCSGGMTLGVKAAADPEVWAIVDGKLHLASSEGAIERFTSDADTNIAKADDNWDRIGQVE